MIYSYIFTTGGILSAVTLFLLTRPNLKCKYVGVILELMLILFAIGYGIYAVTAIISRGGFNVV